MSRGDAISGYYPEMSGPSGVKVYADNIKCQVITGVCVSAGVTYAKTHQLGKTPKFVQVQARLTLGEVTAKHVVALANASAATSASFYVASSKAGAKFTAFILL